MATTDAESMKRAFEDVGFDVDVALPELAHMRTRLRMSPTEVANVYQMFDLNIVSKSSADVVDRGKVSIERLEAFEAFAERERGRSLESKEDAGGSGFGRKRRRAKSGGSTPGSTSGTPGNYVTTSPGTPGTQRRFSFSSATKTPMKHAREWSAELDALGESGESEYKRRAVTPGSARSDASLASQPGGVGANLNEQLAEKIALKTDSDVADVVAVEHLGTEKFRYMRDRISDRVRMIDARVREVETRFAVAVDADDDAAVATQDDAAVASSSAFVSPVGSKTGDEDGHFVGRIVSAHVGSDGKLTDKTVALEGSIDGSSGARVRLELRDLESYSLFPGQVVKVRGRNPAGHCIVAKYIDTDVSVKPFARSKTDSPVFKRGAEVIVASGPFSCSSNLRYEPLHDLLEYVREEKPDALVLCGPLLDAENALVKSGDLGEKFTYYDVVAKVVAKLEDELRERGTKVIFVPSARDVTLDPVFPQPAASVDEFVTDRSRVVSVSNPGTFEINGVVFSACGVDVLKHLSAREISQGHAPKERLGRLAGHVVRQAHAYPLYPPDVSTCLDARHGDALAFERAPDVLILPSDLKAFAEVCEDVVCVNPGRLARGNVGGTLAKIVVHPIDSMESEDADADATRPHEVQKRCRVDVIKIK